MGVSLVIRCLNEGKHIGRLLSGVTQQSVEDVELIVVDSGSTDDTLSIVSEYSVKLLTIAPEDFSFGRSLNLGCQAATKDIIAIASAHVYPTYKDWLEQLVSPFSDPEIAHHRWRSPIRASCSPCASSNEATRLDNFLKRSAIRD